MVENHIQNIVYSPRTEGTLTLGMYSVHISNIRTNKVLF
jgi:hypothetical protein